MAATAAFLSTSMQTYENAQRLIELTRWSSPASTTPDTVFLEEVCDEAIAEFKVEAGAYDPDNYPKHLKEARHLAWAILHEKANQGDLAEKIRKRIPWNEMKRRRSISPSSNATATPTERTEAAPAFDDSVFDDIKAK